MPSEADIQRIVTTELATRRSSILAEIDKTQSQIDLLAERIRFLKASLADCDAAARVLEVKIPELKDQGGTQTRSSGHGQFREQVIEILKAAYPNKLKAAEVGRQAEARLGSHVHPKTPSMTLTRLGKEGIVGRQGRLWYYVPDSDASRSASTCREA